MPPQQMGKTNMYDIPQDEEFVTTTGEKIPGGAPARLENELKDHPKPGINTYLVQFKGKKFEVTGPNFESTTRKIGTSKEAS